MEKELEIPCPYCTGLRGVVYVHSQFHCLQCGNSIDPCWGDTFSEEYPAEVPAIASQPIAPALLLLNGDYIVGKPGG